MFAPWTVLEVRRETDDCVSLALAPPEGFTFRAGQYLTFRLLAGGEELRRSYSLCTAPGDGVVRVAVKQVPGGVFSAYVGERLQPGDELEVMGPEGRFTPDPQPRPHRHVLGVAAGSGITPVLGVVRHVLATEPTARVSVLYGSRTSSSIIFRDELADLKDRYLDRLQVLHVLSREGRDVPLLSGRIDGATVRALLAALPGGLDEAFVCGPQEMSRTVRAALLEAGVDAHRVHVELFGTPTPPPPPPPDPGAGAVRAKVVLAGLTREIEVAPGETVLDAGRRAGLELPWSCTAGVCATCRAQVTGEVDLAANFALEPWELDAGYRLTCQSRPCGQDLVVDYDA